MTRHDQTKRGKSRTALRATKKAPAQSSVWTRVRRPDHDRARRHARQTPFFWVWAVLVGLAALQIYTNLFGLSTLVQHYSQDISNLALTGPFYPTKGRKAVAVALIEDRSLRNLDMAWPWAYGDHARALDAILAFHPRAVVVDLLFVDPRHDPTLVQLLTEINRYSRANIPLYFVGAPNLSPPVRAELSTSGVRLVDPSIVLEQGVARQYPATGACLDSRIRRTHRSNACPSLAERVYEDTYGGTAVPDQNTKGNIELVWGVHIDPINRKWMRVDAGNGVSAACPNTRGMLARLLLAVFNPAALRSQCPYTGVIPIESLMMGTDDKDVQHLIENRVVFYGASLEGGGNKLFSPTNGLIAGVFVHAMALDNLITFEGHPKRNTVSLFGITLDGNFVQTFVVALILLALTALHIGNLRALASADRATQRVGHLARSTWGWNGFLMTTLRHVGWYVAILFGILAAGLGLYYFLDLSIGNWIGIVFVSGILFELLNSSVLGTIWGYLRHSIKS